MLPLDWQLPATSVFRGFNLGRVNKQSYISVHLNNPWEHILIERHKTAVEVAQSCGALATDYFRKLATLEIVDKGLQDFVSEADQNVERFDHSKADLFALIADLGAYRFYEITLQGLVEADPLGGASDDSGSR